MKRNITSLMIVIFTFFVFIISTKAQDKFPVGLYSANSDSTSLTSTDSTYYNLMKELGANWLIIQPHADTKSRYQTDNMKIISMDLDSINNMPNYIYYYTGGYYKKWYAKDAIASSNGTGLKKQTGVGEMEDTLWVSKSTQNTGLLLEGPNYRQDKKYRAWVGNEWGNRINYNMIIRYKVSEIVYPPEQARNVCKITLQYKYLKDGQNTYDIDTAYIDTDDATGEFKMDTISYNLDYFVNKYGESSQRLIENTTVSKFDDNASGQGLNIKFDYLGESKLYIDYIEIYDNIIGLDIKDNPSDVDSNISAYVSAMSSRLPDTTFKYWYSLDEPQTIDNYYPYKFVNNILKTSLSDKPIITTFYPTWGGYRNGDTAIARFVKEVKVDQLLYYYYPIFMKHWDDLYKINGSIYELDIARNILQMAHKSSPDFWYTVQAHGFYYNWNLDKRKPHPNELSAQVMLGLAHGAKGIFYYNFFSYGNDSTKHYALLDSNYNRTDRFNKIKNDLKPRFEGDFGKTLLKLDYTGEYIRFARIVPLETVLEHPPGSYLTISEPTATSSYLNFHAGLFEENNNSYDRYFLISNLICPSGYDKTARLTFSDDFSFTNIKVINVGESFDSTFNGASSFHFDLSIPPGEGYLFKVTPLLKYGGNLVYDDTLNSNLTISDSLIIESTATLTLNKVYTIAEDIYIEDGGMIETNLHGGIVLSSGAEMEFEDWSDGLVISQYDDHPKLYWSEHPSQEELFKYELYRKKDSPSFQLIHTITDKTVTEYEDTAVDIMYMPGANETDAEYYVRTLVMPSRSWVELDTTITVVLEHVEGSAQEKKSAEGIIITEYGLEQNHPNPFNPQTTITYQVPKASHVTLTVYDILGKVVFTLVDEIKGMGRYNLTFDASNLASGTYIYRMEAGKFVESKKMILLK